MQRATAKVSSNAGLNLVLFTLPQSLLLQLGTASMVMLLTAQKATSEAAMAIGQASEELFRGSCLPILDFPEQKQSDED